MIIRFAVCALYASNWNYVAGSNAQSHLSGLITHSCLSNCLYIVFF